MKGFKHISLAELGHLALLCVCATLLLVGAVLLSGGSGVLGLASNPNPQSQTASLLSCFLWGCADAGDSIPPCVISVTPDKIVAGESATLSWTKGGNPFTLEFFNGPAAVGTPVQTLVLTKSDTPSSKAGSLSVTPATTMTYRGTPAGDPVTKAKHQCKVTLAVAGPDDQVPTPTVTITTNAPIVSGVPTIAVGSSADITATYAAHSAGSTVDSLVASAINGPNSTNSAIDGGSWDAPAPTKTYTFSPSAAGDYTFTPAVRTLFFPGWNDYGKSVTIHVVAKPANDVCSNVDGKQPSAPANGYTSGGKCFCEPGYQLDTKGGTCDLSGDICPGTDFPGIQTSLPPNAKLQGSSCACQDDFTVVSGQCIAPTVTEFYANPSLVRPGGPSTLYWKVLNPPASCRISGTDGSDVVIKSPQLAGGSMQTAAISTITVFTMRCGTAPAQQATVRLIPTFEEI